MFQFGPHSVRAAATSKAYMNDVPINVIFKTAGWSYSSTFAKFYKKDIAGASKEDFNSAVLATKD
ncbi:hypothetical protein DPMN_010548 [Dreissena polymorpha]|uniref:Tyr recombinase domain-containing protein n=1 Tax=Dreissena polymorpha TaxID=45954 RepID=A0A9D4MYY6_DREPO|nr:hypothetical protein DPMN_010548 [Dreissena polymorpha]